MKEKNIVPAQVMFFQMLILRPPNSSEFNSNILVKKYFFLKNYVSSEGAVSNNFLYYQELSIALYQVSSAVLSNYQ